jgi:hypothetical protein
VKLKNPQAWAAAQAANPIPEGMSEDPATWTESSTVMGQLYGATVIVYVEKWADKMEARLAEGARLEDIADETSHEANRELGKWGITGFQYGAAVSILSEVWEHGEELRRWHNLKTQLGNEGERANETGGVLNPALLNVDVGGDE